MKFKFENILKSKKVSREDRLKEKKEEEEYGKTSHKNLSGLSDRFGRETEGEIDPANQHDSLEAEELVEGQEYKDQFEDEQQGKFVSVEDLPSSESLMDDNGDYPVEKEFDEKMEEIRLLNGENKDVYDYGSIIEKILEDIHNNKNKSKKETEKEIDRLLYKVNNFIKEYRNILDRGLPYKKEYKAVRGAFKRYIGDVVYSSGERVEVLPRFVKVRDAKAPVNNTNIEKVKSSHYKAYNPATGKKEDI